MLVFEQDMVANANKDRFVGTGDKRAVTDLWCLALARGPQNALSLSTLKEGWFRRVSFQSRMMLSTLRSLFTHIWMS